MNISRFKALGEGLLVPVGVLLIWQIACSAGWVNPMVLPSPAAVAARWWSYLAPLEPFNPATESRIAWIFSGELLHDSIASLSRVVMGLRSARVSRCRWGCSWARAIPSIASSIR